jgi:4'-phosphopantetheinyl transferase
LSERDDGVTATTTPLEHDEVRVFTIDSDDSATVRDAARRIIGGILGIPPERIEFCNAPGGKPFLRDNAELQFSISHSEKVAMVAVTRVAAVGVDIERIHLVRNAEAIVRRFFPPDEAAGILDSDQPALHFAEAWTRSEARVKERGAGVWNAAEPAPGATVRQLSAPEGFAAAVAVGAADWVISQYNISIADLVGL